MAKKLVCDRCGKEIKEHTLIKHNQPYEVALTTELELYGYSRKSWDLCYECSEELKKFIEGYKGE